MKKRTFIITINGFSGNILSWEIYTTDGETPDNTLYSYKDGNYPSWSQQEQITKKIETQDWEEIF
jgi:hypothetical protein